MDYRSSAYESQKYAFTLNSLSRDHYSSALEIGCSVGVMTKQLAQRCDALLAIDVSESALRQAKQQCSEAHVEFALMRVPEDWPKGSFDLIMISEVLYYRSAADFDVLIERLRHALALDGEIILVHHWAGGRRKRTWFDVANRRHDRLIARLRDFVQVTQHENTEDYRFDCLPEGLMEPNVAHRGRALDTALGRRRRLRPSAPAADAAAPMPPAYSAAAPDRPRVHNDHRFLDEDFALKVFHIAKSPVDDKGR